MTVVLLGVRVVVAPMLTHILRIHVTGNVKREEQSLSALQPNWIGVDVVVEDLVEEVVDLVAEVVDRFVVEEEVVDDSTLTQILRSHVAEKEYRPTQSLSLSHPKAILDPDDEAGPVDIC